MGLLFKSREEKARLSIIKNLLALSLIDGEIHENEKLMIAAIATREGISDREFKNMLEGKDNTKFTIPEDLETREKFLKDMVALMMVDGKIDEKELALCKLTAIKFGYRPEVIDAMFLNFLDELKK
ncbi:MAG: TerB family tellurite resistance protein [Bacteroidales bacterium]|nr:TerB family tellurite resistance protein [Bacteroidales bacterium]